MIEIWKDIEGYEGKYQISSMGRVKALNYNHSGCEKILKEKQEKNGYKRVGLFKDGRQKLYSIHRLVAQAFIPNENECPLVNHIDENKTNNCVNNLEWCDESYNITYSIGKSIMQISLDGELIKIYDSAVIAAKETKICRACISKCCLKQQKQAGGFYWEFIDTKKVA